jgi:hypothetical protein
MPICPSFRSSGANENEQYPSSYMSKPAGRVSVERLMSDIEAGARGDRRARLAAAGGPAEYADPELYAAVERVLQRAVARDEQAILLPEILNDDEAWRLQAGIRWSTHRPVIGGAILAIKRRLLLPLMRWLFEYSRDNFRRQQRMNRLLAACIEELAIENARLRREIEGLQNAAIAGRERPAIRE